MSAISDHAERIINNDVLFVAANGTDYDIYCLEGEGGVRAVCIDQHDLASVDLPNLTADEARKLARMLEEAAGRLDTK